MPTIQVCKDNTGKLAVRRSMTLARLKEVLEYDQDTGVFIWRVRTSNRIKVGSVAGNLSHGYIEISVDGVSFRAHVLAWLWMTGHFPPVEIDHRNTIKSDNRWENLREATHAFNAQNMRSAHKDNKAGLLGVEETKYGRFEARISVDGRRLYLGAFETADLAHAEYVKAKRELHPGGTL